MILTPRDHSLLQRMTTTFMARGGERIPLFADLSPQVQRAVLDRTPEGSGLDAGAHSVLSAYPEAVEVG